ncbi:SAM-dependent methyltransferase [Providencia rettgeri]|uniref:site-specific DNA-methyltransferase (adenine-specific) n=1 Tax=Providencia rettgeri TaxID=587 RepID=A0AAP2NWI7_PRORE|nr:N-6 DNA methylase [Providencia rettgeri]MBX6951414.1 SAM-dependent methyltransferase [Providencia rettgeri]MBX6954203.1 SAM-dependent methyltransferase [Providencia rettgeri]MBX6960781.1 SAM-dependent methyltransferase [Providencia rettgeri]MBX6973245.1 SAM-dependent methyltransferase [Providencia rettgeri]MBX6981379.1 SAM-dependent methyltransferase [Providencia rettgeri]
MTNNDIVQKLWNLCDVLRDDGINYSDYVTELVLLLFVKMVHENTEAGTLKKHPLPEGCRWTDINAKSGINLLNDYKAMLLALSTGKRTEADPNEPGKTIEVQVHEDPLISAIYADAQTRLREPRHLEQMIKTLDQIDWFSAQKDGLGDLYEGLLEKNASETKSGAGQYFTPRALINSMVRCIKPQVGEIIQDPAAGTAGFLVAADLYMREQTDDYMDLSAKDADFQKNKAFVGVELVPNTRRLALMNCLLHSMEGDNEGVVHLGNSLGEAGKSLKQADVILANPPFGTSKGGEASNTRDDLTYKTSNKQLAFLQHIYRNLKPGGRAAVVLPDNVLFEAGVGTDVRRDLMNKCNLHTLLRLPTGIFYAQGVKTNVLFFTKGSAKNKYQEENCTENVWVYDLRTNMPSFGKRTPFGNSNIGFTSKDFGTDPHLGAFEKVFGDNSDGTSKRTEGEYSFNVQEIEVDKETVAENQGVDDRLAYSRWRCFSREWISKTKDDSLDISWLRDKNSVDAEDLPEPSILAQEAKEELEAALSELHELLVALEGGK